MGEPARKLETTEPPHVPTFEELWKQIEDLPENVTGEILEPGVISTMSRPRAKHRRTARECLLSLRDASADRSGVGWWIEQEPDVRFGQRTTAPDIAGWRVERCPEPPEGSPIVIIPDFCCEILSPSTANRDRTKKLPLYARSGVEWIWLVDPDLQFVEVYQSVNGRAVLMDSADGQETKRLAPFDLDIDFSRWWLMPKIVEPTTE
jgi:Uma2 family endonuclease